MPGAVEVTGVAQALKRLHVAKGETARGMERGLTKAALRLLALSQRVVPVDTGNLKGSGFVRKQGSGFSTECMVGYSTDYAVFVHENLEARHAPGTYAKFVERPMRENARLLGEIIRGEAAKGSRGTMPNVVAPDVSSHALLPIPARASGLGVSQVGGGKVTYRGGWRKHS